MREGEEELAGEFVETVVQAGRGEVGQFFEEGKGGLIAGINVAYHVRDVGGGGGELEMLREAPHDAAGDPDHYLIGRCIYKLQLLINYDIPAKYFK